MAFDWRKYLEVARALQACLDKTVDAEAAGRSAVSRAYYAAFGHTRNYAATNLGFDVQQNPDDHGRLRAFLKTGKTQNIAKRLDRLRQWRNECDYQDDLSGDVETFTANAIDEAAKILASLIPPAPPSSTLQHPGP